MPSQTIIINNKKMTFLIIVLLLLLLAIFSFIPETVLVTKNNIDYECTCSGITIQRKHNTFFYKCLGFTYNCTEWYPLGAGEPINYDNRMIRILD